MLSSLPDDTAGELNALNQGEKWRSHKIFQNPMVTLSNGKDIWVGYLLQLQGTRPAETHFLVHRFYKEKKFQDSYVEYAEGYFVLNYPFLSVSRRRYCVPLSVLTSTFIINKVDFFVTDTIFDRFILNEEKQTFHAKPIDTDDTEIVFNLLNNSSFCERWKVHRSEGLMKVVVAPLMLFTDDTSGNLSKQYNLFDSYLLIPAAMSYDARSSKNNSFFMCTSNKKLTSVDMLPAIVDVI